MMKVGAVLVGSVRDSQGYQQLTFAHALCLLLHELDVVADQNRSVLIILPALGCHTFFLLYL